MTVENRFALVEVCGDPMLTMFDGQTVRVAMRPLAEKLGIDWSRQLQKIKADPVLSAGVTLSVIPSERGAQQTVTLPIDLMQGWLFKLNPERVAPEARDRVIAYQAECYQVLHDYWVKGSATNPRMVTAEFGDRTARRRELPGLLEKMERTRHPESLRILHELATRACAVEGIAPPALESYAADVRESAAVDALLARIDALVREMPALDYHRDPMKIAVRRAELAAHGMSISNTMLAALKRHSRFAGHGSVNPSGGRKPAHCLIFHAAGLEIIPV